MCLESSQAGLHTYRLITEHFQSEEPPSLPHRSFKRSLAFLVFRRWEEKLSIYIFALTLAGDGAGHRRWCWIIAIQLSIPFVWLSPTMVPTAGSGSDSERRERYNRCRLTVAKESILVGWKLTSQTAAIRARISAVNPRHTQNNKDNQHLVNYRNLPKIRRLTTSTHREFWRYIWISQLKQTSLWKRAPLSRLCFKRQTITERDYVKLQRRHSS